MTRQIKKIDNWKFWIGIAYIGLAATVIWLFFLNQRSSQTQARQARDEAVHQAESESALAAQRSSCLDSIPTLQRINVFVDGVHDLHAVLEQNSKALLDAAPADQRKVRLANWLRIKATVKKVAGIHFPVPTRAECRALGKPR